MKPQYLQIAALLAETSAGDQPFADATEMEIEKFAANAQQLAYSLLRKMLAERWGEGRTWQPVPDHGVEAAGVHGFTLRRCKTERFVSAATIWWAAPFSAQSRVPNRRPSEWRNCARTFLVRAWKPRRSCRVF